MTQRESDILEKLNDNVTKLNTEVEMMNIEVQKQNKLLLGNGDTSKSIVVRLALNEKITKGLVWITALQLSVILGGVYKLIINN